jgi:nitrate reductase alpha subunit
MRRALRMTADDLHITIHSTHPWIDRKWGSTQDWECVIKSESVISNL